MSDYSTEDCKALLNHWLHQNYAQPGAALNEWKRIKKSKNASGQWVRLFENKQLNIEVEVLETESGLEIKNEIPNAAEKTVDKGWNEFRHNVLGLPKEKTENEYLNYYFAFSAELDETFGEYPVFCVVEKSYYDQNESVACVHFMHAMPKEFEQDEESCFSVHDMTKKEARNKLLEMGFQYSKKLEKQMNGE